MLELSIVFWNGIDDCWMGFFYFSGRFGLSTAIGNVKEFSLPKSPKPEGYCKWILGDTCYPLFGDDIGSFE